MTLDRRQFLRRAAAAMTVAAFVPETKSWICSAHPPPNATDIPDLDGELFLSGEILDLAASDFGRCLTPTTS